MVNGGSLPTPWEGQLSRRYSYKIKKPSTDGFSSKVEVTRFKIFIAFKDIHSVVTSNQGTRPLLTIAADMVRICYEW